MHNWHKASGRIHRNSLAWIGVGCAVIGVLVAAIVYIGRQPTVTIRVGDGVFRARVASTDAQREKGLGGTRELADHQALLFTYGASQKNDVWMKDMYIPIDAVWLDEDKRVVHIEKGLRPESYPKTYGPSMPTRYVIEFAAGVVQRYAIKVGMQVIFSDEAMMSRSR